MPEDDNPKMLVLDGQQRLQSLFIGLKGSYNGMELYFNVLSGDSEAPEDIMYDFKFKKPAEGIFPFVKLKAIVNTEKTNRELREEIIEKNGNLNPDEQKRIEDNVDLVRAVFTSQDKILYQVVDSIDRPTKFKEEDIVEIFIRANSGGTLLSKSDLLFTLLVASWEDSETEISELLEDLNLTGYDFSRDFILKTCLTILKRGAKYEISKFRDPNLKIEIEQNWNVISNTLRFIKDFVYEHTYMRTDKTLPSYLSLIPIIYFKYHFPENWHVNVNNIKDYLLKVNLTGVFGGVTDAFTDGLIDIIENSRQFSLTEIFGFIRDQGKSIEISEKKLFEIHYGAKEIHLLFNIWYGFNYQPALLNNQPNVDHIFPQSVLKTIKEINPETGRRTISKYPAECRDKLTNLMLLTSQENQAGGKGDKMPEEWFEDAVRNTPAYRDRHLIPDDPELWKLDNFELFLEARKRLIIQKFTALNLLRVEPVQNQQ